MGLALDIWRYQNRSERRRKTDHLEKHGGVDPWHCVYRDTNPEVVLQGCVKCNGRYLGFQCNHPEIKKKKRDKHLALVRINSRLRDVVSEEGMFVCSDCPHRTLFSMPDNPSWSVGVVSAPRRDPTLKVSLISLRDAGFRKVTVYSEPGEVGDAPDAKIKKNKEVLGGLRNWLSALQDLVDNETDMIFICQDDVIYNSRVRQYLESNWPLNAEIVSPYCNSSYWIDADYVPIRGPLVGALCFAMPRITAVRLLSDRTLTVNTTENNNYDISIGRWADRYGIPIYCSIPSLAQHIGDTSTIWDKGANAGRRRSSTFQHGADAMSMIPMIPKDDKQKK